MTFESVIAPEAPSPAERERAGGEGDNGRHPQTSEVSKTSEVSTALEQAKAELAALEAKMAPLQAQIDQLTRQFWVSRKDVKANKYDLTIEFPLPPSPPTKIHPHRPQL